MDSKQVGQIIDFAEELQGVPLEAWQRRVLSAVFGARGGDTVMLTAQGRVLENDIVRRVPSQKVAGFDLLRDPALAAHQVLVYQQMSGFGPDARVVSTFTSGGEKVPPK